MLTFRARKILYRRGRYEYTLSTRGASIIDGSAMIKEDIVVAKGVGEDVLPNREKINDEEVLVRKDKKDNFEWIVPNDDW
jgi:hypothetical protein